MRVCGGGKHGTLGSVNRHKDEGSPRGIREGRWFTRLIKREPRHGRLQGLVCVANYGI